MRRSSSGSSAGREREADFAGGSARRAMANLDLATVFPRDPEAEGDVQSAEAGGHEEVAPGGGREQRGGADEHETGAHDGNAGYREGSAGDHAGAVEQQPGAGQVADQAG